MKYNCMSKKFPKINVKFHYNIITHNQTNDHSNIITHNQINE